MGLYHTQLINHVVVNVADMSGGETGTTGSRLSAVVEASDRLFGAFPVAVYLP